MKDVDDVIQVANERVSVYRQYIKNGNADILRIELDIARREGLIEGILLSIDWMNQIGDDE